MDTIAIILAIIATCLTFIACSLISIANALWDIYKNLKQNKWANMETNKRCKHLRTDDGCRWCELGYMLQCDRCRERNGNDENN